MASGFDFAGTFKLLTGYAPFPWQERLYQRFEAGDFAACTPCSIPTGLGKTALIACWLIALARNPAQVPRRLAYVVNRRTVVDQTTSEVEQYRERLLNSDARELVDLRQRLTELCAFTPGCFPSSSQASGDSPHEWSPLAISTLRGQFADNQEWSLDPARPAVICGTVDMLGSRLLFSGYRLGFKSRPHHAGLLGHDTLFVHDEAHLEPAFQRLLEQIVEAQKSDRTGDCDAQRRLKAIALSATSRTAVPTFGLLSVDLENETVRRRMHAPKRLTLHSVEDDQDSTAKIIELAARYHGSGAAVLIFACTVQRVEEVAKALREQAAEGVETLTGTMRGYERDQLVRKPAFVRFLPESHQPADVAPQEGTSYLVCTSAGEVGVNISADHLVCDLTTFESMAQRFGRVNRFGTHPDTQIDVVYPSTFDDNDPLSSARQATLSLLQRLNGQASPQALSLLPGEARAAAFAPTPVTLPTSDILFDSWSLTTVRDRLPGRPEVEPYLHGQSPAAELPETQFAWREEVGILQGPLLDHYAPQDLLDEYPLKPHELLREPSSRAFQHLQRIAARRPDDVAWLLEESGRFLERVPLRELASRNRKDRIQGLTVLLSPESGGLSPQGMLDGSSPTANDVADELYLDANRTRRQRRRFWDETEAVPEGLRLIWTIDARPDADDGLDESPPRRYWHWYALPQEGVRSGRKPVEWGVHVGDVAARVQALLQRLPLPDDIQAALRCAARYHDHGKRRRQFQTVLGNTRFPELVLAKSGRRGGRLQETYRHEFGSLLDVLTLSPGSPEAAEWSHLSPEAQDLALHLIAAHHGRARPHFPAPDEDFDPEPPDAIAVEDVALETPRRFARLQRRYGRWGLAYLESLLRAADWHASAAPSRELDEEMLRPTKGTAGQELAS